MNSFVTNLQNIYDTIRRSTYVLGGIILGMLVWSIISGILIALFYHPFPGMAFESVAQMTTNPLIDFIRNFHYWSSDILFILLIFHLTRVIVSRVTDRFKRIAYWIGLAMAFLLANELLFGTFIRADQEAYEAYAHFWVGAKSLMPGFLVPIIEFIGAGETALLRFFLFHAIIIPVLLLVLIVVHSVYAATFRGLTAQVKAGVQKYMPSKTPASENVKLSKFPQLRVMVYSILVLTVITALLSYLYPAPLLGRPFGGVEITKPPWYLLWVYGLENFFGLPAIIYGPMILAGILIVLPFLSRRRAKLDPASIIFFIILAAIFVLGYYAALAQEVSHLEHFQSGM